MVYGGNGGSGSDGSGGISSCSCDRMVMVLVGLVYGVG